MGDAVPPREELPRGPESAGQLRGPRQDGGTRLMIVFPAVDIQGGKAVRLRRGDFDDVTVFGDDPVALARFWQDQGAEALHVVDLDAAGIGVHWVVMGTAAVTALDLLDDSVKWLGERLVVGLDCTDGMVATHGWQQRSQMSAIHFSEILTDHGVKRVVYTDTARDGMLGGPCRCTPRA